MRYMANVVFLFSLAFTARAQATVLCSYAAYAPSSIQYFLSNQLNEAGVAVVPAHFFAGHPQEPGHYVVAGNSMFNGGIMIHEDRYYGTKTLQIFNTAGRMIGHSEESVKGCRFGICRTSRLSVVTGGEPVTLGVSQTANHGVVYFVEYNGLEEELDVTMWRSQFGELMHTLSSTLLDFRTSTLLIGNSPTERFAISLASDPEIVPYLHLINIFLDGRGRLVLSGRINHQVYNRIIDLAIDGGFYNIVPNVVIDSDILIEGPLPPEDLERCL